MGRFSDMFVCTRLVMLSHFLRLALPRCTLPHMANKTNQTQRIVRENISDLADDGVDDVSQHVAFALCPLPLPPAHEWGKKRTRLPSLETQETQHTFFSFFHTTDAVIHHNVYVFDGKRVRHAATKNVSKVLWPAEAQAIVRTVANVLRGTLLTRWCHLCAYPSGGFDDGTIYSLAAMFCKPEAVMLSSCDILVLAHDTALPTLYPRGALVKARNSDCITH